MPKFRPDPARGGWPLALVLLAAASACAGRGLLAGSPGSHPSELVGEWIDSAKTSAADSSLWVFTSSGDDEVRRVRASGERSVRHYGYWFVQGSVASGDRALCFTNRPGRSAPSCQPFDLDSVRTASGLRKRMVVRGYRGAHSTRDRVLLEYP